MPSPKKMGMATLPSTILFASPMKIYLLKDTNEAWAKYPSIHHSTKRN
jgi:hypothetical protein